MSDLISRQAAIKAIDDLPNCYNGYSDTYDKAYIIGTLEEVPSVEPKKGRCTNESRYFHCSICNYGVNDVFEGGYTDNTTYVFEKGGEWNYCPNCGAKMDEVSDE